MRNENKRMARCASPHIGFLFQIGLIDVYNRKNLKIVTIGFKKFRKLAELKFSSDLKAVAVAERTVDGLRLEPYLTLLRERARCGKIL